MFMADNETGPPASPGSSGISALNLALCFSAAAIAMATAALAFQTGRLLASALERDLEAWATSAVFSLTYATSACLFGCIRSRIQKRISQLLAELREDVCTSRQRALASAQALAVATGATTGLHDGLMACLFVLAGLFINPALGALLGALYASAVGYVLWSIFCSRGKDAFKAVAPPPVSPLILLIASISTSLLLITAALSAAEAITALILAAAMLRPASILATNSRILRLIWQLQRDVDSQDMGIPAETTPDEAPASLPEAKISLQPIAAQSFLSPVIEPVLVIHRPVSTSWRSNQ